MSAEDPTNTNINGTAPHEPALTALPSGKVAYITETGQELRLPLIGTIRSLDVLRKASEGKSGYEYLDAVVAFFKDRHEVELSLDEADAIEKDLLVRWLKKKSEHESNIATMLQSPSSTA